MHSPNTKNEIVKIFFFSVNWSQIVPIIKDKDIIDFHQNVGLKSGYRLESTPYPVIVVITPTVQPGPCRWYLPESGDFVRPSNSQAFPQGCSLTFAGGGVGQKFRVGKR
jgi:hypothetical protein